MHEEEGGGPESQVTVRQNSIILIKCYMFLHSDKHKNVLAGLNSNKYQSKANFILRLNSKVTDRRFQLPLSLFCLLTFHLLFFFLSFSCVVILRTFSVVLSD